MFNSEKTKQFISYLLSKSDGTMNYTKLLKLMYIIDRNSLKSRGFPLTYDTYISMDNGPVLSVTYDAIKGIDMDGGNLWGQDLQRADSVYEVSWNGETLIGKLSRADIRLIDSVWTEFGDYSYSELITYVHKFKEWKDPSGTSIPISYEQLLKELDYDDSEIGLIANDIRETQRVGDLIAD